MAAGSEGDAEGELAAAVGSAGCEEAGEVGACSGEHEQRESGDAPEEAADDFAVVAVEAWVDEAEGLAVVGLRIFFCELGGDGVEVFDGPFGGYAGLEPSDDGDSDRCAVVQEIAGPELLLVHDGDPVVGPDEALGTVELRGGHADDREGMLVEFNGRADDVGVGLKCAAPESVAENHIRG